jgi:hypothetical protein
VSFFKPKFVVSALSVAVLAALSAGGCSGSAFTVDTGAGGSSAGSSQTQAGSSSQGAGKACGGP